MGYPCPIDISVFDTLMTNLPASIAVPVSDLKKEPLDCFSSYIFQFSI
jgi:hypothetical protein